MKKLIIALALLTSLGESFAINHDDPGLKWGSCPPIFDRSCAVTILNGDPALNSSDVFIRVPAKFVFPAHTHTSPEHIVLISGEMTVQYKGKAAVKVIPGSYLYGPAKAPHKAECSDKGQCVLFIGFESPIDAFKVKDF